MEDTGAFKSLLDRCGGKLPAYAWPGGYPMFYLDRECSTLCPKCAQKSLDDEDELEKFKPCAYGINDEDPTLYCDQCSERIPSSYAEDDAPAA